MQKLTSGVKLYSTVHMLQQGTTSADTGFYLLNLKDFANADAQSATSWEAHSFAKQDLNLTTLLITRYATLM